MKKLFAIAAISLLAGLILFSSCVPIWGAPLPFGRGGMMSGRGMMGGGGMMGGQGYSNDPQAKPITIEQATESAQRYIDGWGGKLRLTEVMRFAWNYYAEAEEADTGIHAMELIIDRYTGNVYPEQGPDMMWNTKYGMMGRQSSSASATMPVDAEQANTIAQQYLDNNMPGLTVAEVDSFYGYYTLHTLKNGQTEGMLSVNGYTGAVWYHSWHGLFIDMKELD